LTYDPEAKAKFLTADIAGHLHDLARDLALLADYSKEGIEGFLRRFTEARNVKLKIIAQPLRVALTGKTVSPGIDEVMVTLGKERVIKRLEDALAIIAAEAGA